MLISLMLFTAATIAIIAAYQVGRKAAVQPGRSTSENKSVTTSSICSSKDTSLECELILLKNHTLDDAVDYFNRNAKRIPALQRLLDLYQVERKFPDLSYFRLGPNMFDKIILDWIIIYNSNTNQLVGHGITTRIGWDQEKEVLAGGWQDVVRTSYVHSLVLKKQRNTLVGLFIFVEDQFRQQGWANNVIEQMRSLAQHEELQALIIPLRPPLRFKKEYATMPIAEFAQLKREDGLPLDHWVRLHVRLGAKILGASETSHQHILSLQDFNQLFSSTPLPHSGHVLVERNNEWYNVLVDIERDFVLIRQGCVWVQHEF